jgi:hypothetical protein
MRLECEKCRRAVSGAREHHHFCLALHSRQEGPRNYATKTEMHKRLIVKLYNDIVHELKLIK